MVLCRLTEASQPAILSLLGTFESVTSCAGTAGAAASDITATSSPTDLESPGIGLRHSITGKIAHLVVRSTASSWTDWGATCRQGSAHHPRCPSGKHGASGPGGAVSVYFGRCNRIYRKERSLWPCIPIRRTPHPDLAASHSPGRQPGHPPKKLLTIASPAATSFKRDTWANAPVRSPAPSTE